MSRHLPSSLILMSSSMALCTRRTCRFMTSPREGKARTSRYRAPGSLGCGMLRGCACEPSLMLDGHIIGNSFRLVKHYFRK